MTRALVLALLVAIAGVAGAAEELKLPPLSRATLDNGLRVVVAEYHELPLVEVYAIVGAGSAQDPAGKEGLSALTAGTLTRGTKRLSAEELARAIESLGGHIDASPGTDGTTLTAEFLSKDFAAGLDLLRQVVLEPKFARDEVRRAREEQLARIVAALESTSAVADKCYAGFLYGTHPYGRPVEGRRAAVEDLGRGDVSDFYERWYRPSNTVLVLVGDVIADDAVARLREAFGGWEDRRDAVAPALPVPTPVTTRRVLLVDKADATQTQIRFGNLAMQRNDRDFLPSNVANTILGGGFTSKLIEELRVKRSLTYSAYSMFVGRKAAGDFRVSTFTKGPTTAETLGLALRVLGDFRSQPPDPKVLGKGKSYLLGQFPLKVESPDALAGRLAEVEFFGLPPDELSTYRSRVAAVTPAEAARVAAGHMPAPEQVAIVVVGKAAEIRDQLTREFGPLETIPAEQCENLSATRR